MSKLQEQLNEIKRQKDEILIPSNVKSGVEYLGQVGTYSGGGGSGDVKLFDTIEHMQSDPNPEEGDLALVYRSEISNWQEDTEVQIINFPSVVELPQAFTGNIYTSFRGTDVSLGCDAQVQLSASEFRFDAYNGMEEIRVEYSSSDGITYTKTRGDDTVDCGTPIVWSPWEEFEAWNDNIGYFMQTGGNVFEGLFSYDTKYLNKERAQIFPISAYSLVNNEIVEGDIGDESVSIQDILDIIEDIIVPSTSHYFNCYIYRKNNVWYFLNTPPEDASYIFSYSITLNGTIIWYYDTPSRTITRDLYTIDFNTKTATLDKTYSIPARSTTYFTNDNSSDIVPIPIYVDKGGIKIGPQRSNSVNVYSNTSRTYTLPVNSRYAKESKYVHNNNQLDTTADLVYKNTFYGKNGVEIGTLGTPDNSFADGNAKVFAEIKDSYDNMTPRILADGDTIDKNIYVIPTNADGTTLLDTSNVTNMSQMFRECSNLKFVSSLDASSATNMLSMFYGCRKLESVALTNASNVTNIGHMFNGCTSLTTISLLDTSNVTSMLSTFDGCTSLTTIPLLDTSSVTIMNDTFSGCSSLTSLPLLNTSSVTAMDNTFNECPLLDNTSLNNILAMCTNATKITSSYKTLKTVGLSQTQAQTCTTLSNWSACQSAGWTTGY